MFHVSSNLVYLKEFPFKGLYIFSYLQLQPNIYFVFVYLMVILSAHLYILGSFLFSGKSKK